MVKFLWYFFLIALTGCASKDFYQVNEHDPIDTDSYSAIYFVADNQFHLANGGAYPLENYVCDKFTGVAVRPPQTTVFAPQYFKTLLSGLDGKRLVIHLGDAADIACRQEIDQFFEIMQSYNGPWVFIPGNHDCYYTGNSQNNTINAWEEACAGKRSDKAFLLATYLEKNFGKKLSDDFSGTIEGRWEKGDYRGRYAADIIRGVSSHKSYILQEVCFKPKHGDQIRMILLDTTQYLNPPAYRNFGLFFGHKVAGITGEILENQMQLAEKWAKEQDQLKETLIFAGHHPLKEHSYSKSGLAWFSGTKWLKSIIDESNAKGYVSAHTHEGGIRSFGKDKVEWNVASLVDWPLGLSAMQIKEGVPEIKEILYNREREVPGVDGLCSSNIEWKYDNQDDFAFYTHYREIEGLSGPYMQHYLLIANLEVITNALKNIDPDGSESYILNMERLLREEKYDFYNRQQTHSGEKIEELRPHITEAISRLNHIFELNDEKKAKMMQKYGWCQLWWSAKEDAQNQWNVPDVTNMRKK